MTTAKEKLANLRARNEELQAKISPLEEEVSKLWEEEERLKIDIFYEDAPEMLRTIPWDLSPTFEQGQVCNLMPSSDENSLEVVNKCRSLLGKSWHGDVGLRDGCSLNFDDTLMTFSFPTAEQLIQFIQLFGLNVNKDPLRVFLKMEAKKHLERIKLAQAFGIILE